MSSEDLTWYELSDVVVLKNFYIIRISSEESVPSYLFLCSLSFYLGLKGVSSQRVPSPLKPVSKPHNNKTPVSIEISPVLKKFQRIDS